MRKVRLSLDKLVVDSFETVDGKQATAGTVRGHDFSQVPICTSGESECATCLPGGCPAQTRTCFASCLMTNGHQACIGQEC